jgi:hypothetical protein
MDPGSRRGEPAPGCTLADIGRMLTATPAMVWAELQGMPDALRRWRPRPGEWCALEVLGHLTEADMRAFLNRVVLLREEPGAVFERWDPDAVAAARRDHERDAQALLDEFAKVRALGVSVVRELGPADLRLAGVHPDVGELTVANLLAEWVAHDRAHLAQIGSIVRAAMLPGMGNAAAFGHAEEAAAWWRGTNRSSG